MVILGSQSHEIVSTDIWGLIALLSIQALQTEATFQQKYNFNFPSFNLLRESLWFHYYKGITLSIEDHCIIICKPTFENVIIAFTIDQKNMHFIVESL